MRREGCRRGVPLPPETRLNQIVKGAPADVFASANMEHPQSLAAATRMYVYGYPLVYCLPDKPSAGSTQIAFLIFNRLVLVVWVTRTSI